MKDWPEHLMSQSRVMVILTKCATSRSIIKEILIVRHVMDINIKLLDRAVSRIHLVIFDKNPVISGEILYNTPGSLVLYLGRYQIISSLRFRYSILIKVCY